MVPRSAAALRTPTPAVPRPLPPGASFDEGGEFPQGLFGAQSVVLRPDARWEILAADGDLRAVGGVGEARGDGHLARESRVGRLELHDFHDLLVGDQFEEAAPERIRVVGGLAARRLLRVPVGERHAEGAAFPRVEDLHVAGHGVRHAPPGQRVRIEAGAIDDRARPGDGGCPSVAGPTAPPAGWAGYNSRQHKKYSPIRLTG